MDYLSSKKLDEFNLLTITYGKEEIINQNAKIYQCKFLYSMDLVPLISSFLVNSPIYSYGKLYTGNEEESFINLIPNLNYSENHLPEMDVVSIKKKLTGYDVYQLENELDYFNPNDNIDSVIIYRYYDIKPNIFDPAKGFLQEEEIEIIQWDLEEYLNFQVIIHHPKFTNSKSFQCSFKVNINIEENYNLIPEKKDKCNNWLIKINKLIYKISTIKLNIKSQY